MDPAPDSRRQLGQIMVDEGFLTEAQLLDALAEQNRSGTPLGKVLVDLGFVSPGAVANALAEQHGGLLRTEYGTSAGLREMASRAPIRTDAAPPAQPTPPTPVPVAPQPVQAAPPPLGAGLRLAQPAPEQAAEPAPQSQFAPAPQPTPLPEPKPEAEQAPAPPAPEPVAEAPAPAPSEPTVDDGAERIAELESKLHAVLTERNSLAQSLNELKAANVGREELEQAAHEARERIVELERHLGDKERELEDARAQQDQHSEQPHEELEHLGRQLHEAQERAVALEARVAERERELEEARAQQHQQPEHPHEELEHLGRQLHEASERREAAEARVTELEHALASAQEHAPVAPDEALVSRIAELDQALHAAGSERDEAVARVAALEPELASVRDQVREHHDLAAKVDELERALASAHAEREAVAANAGTPPAEVADLRRQVSERDRELADSVSEMAKMSREHRALLQLVERQLAQDEAGATPAPERTHVLFVPSATGYTLVERDGVAPSIGAFVELSEPRGRFVVRRLGPSPLPGPKRRCAYLERV